LVAQKREHGFLRFGQERRGGLVIEIYARHLRREGGVRSGEGQPRIEPKGERKPRMNTNGHE
jgi:hypothetical protein